MKLSHETKCMIAAVLTTMLITFSCGGPEAPTVQREENEILEKVISADSLHKKISLELIMNFSPRNQYGVYNLKIDTTNYYFIYTDKGITNFK